MFFCFDLEFPLILRGLYLDNLSCEVIRKVRRSGRSGKGKESFSSPPSPPGLQQFSLRSLQGDWACTPPPPCPWTESDFWPDGRHRFHMVPGKISPFLAQIWGPDSHMRRPGPFLKSTVVASGASGRVWDLACRRPHFRPCGKFLGRRCWARQSWVAWTPGLRQLPVFARPGVTGMGWAGWFNVFEFDIDYEYILECCSLP